MISDRKRESNRENAKRSTGPRSEQGRRRSAKNALSHGLNLPLRTAARRREVDELAFCLASANGKAVDELFLEAAEAQFEGLRVVKARAAVLEEFDRKPESERSYLDLNDKLQRLERYQGRSFTRIRKALRVIASAV